jgi:uncharacterized protein
MLEEIVFLGQTGAGKTSLINTLFDLEWFVDPALSSTKELHRHTGRISKRIADQEKHWVVVDTPGVGESEVADGLYLSMLHEVFHSCKVLVWVTQANTRAYSEDQVALLKLTSDRANFPKAKCCILVNQIDKVHPENWDLARNRPSVEQQKLISEKLELVYSRFHKYFPVERDNVFPVSAQKVYGFEQFINALV